MTNIMKKMLRRFRDSESGATLVEYGIAITLAIFLGAGALAYLATAIDGNMVDAADAMDTEDNNMVSSVPVD